MTRAALVGMAAAGLLAVGSPAFAQNPHGAPPGLLKKKGPPGTPGSPSTTPGGVDGGGPVSRVRSLGVWLDDATAMAPGEGWLTVSLQRWSAPVVTGIDAPVFDLLGGVVSRVHVFASIPYSRTSYTGLPSSGELGTLYFGGKFVMRVPDDGGIGVAISPAVEVLNPSAIVDTGYSRVNAVLPLNAEWRHERTRIYGSTGVFTRGAYFLSGAVEQTLTDRLVATGALSQAWATGGDALAEELGLRSSRTDLSGSVAWVVSPHLMLFASGARTISPLDADATRFALSAGASMNLYRPGRRLPVKKP